MSETLYLPLALLAFLLAEHTRIRPTAPMWLGLGLVIGLATLTRADALLLVVFAMVPTAILSREPIRRIAPRSP